MKNKRHNKIIEIIESDAIETQDDLISRLREQGFNVTQATISRDIKELGIVKISTMDNRYRYSLPRGMKTSAYPKNTNPSSARRSFMSTAL